VLTSSSAGAISLVCNSEAFCRRLVTGLRFDTMNARYAAPMGRVGELVDRAMMHRVAALTMTDFAERLAQALAAELEQAEGT
jgi:hypothetical protein